MNKRNRFVDAVCRLGVWATLLFASTIQAEGLVFSTAPTHSPEEATKLYAPLARYLSAVTGEPVVFRPVENYIRYNWMVLKDEADLLFDGPHLSSWRMARFGHVPLVRFPGEIRIVVAVREDGPTTLEELGRGRKVCAFASPNMLTLAFMNHFTNPARQPQMLREQGFADVLECLRSERGQAAVLRDKIWEKTDQTGLRLLPLPDRGYPERTLTVATRVGPALREKIRTALLSPEGAGAAAELLKRFKKERFVAAKPEAYAGLDVLLNPVWGFADWSTASWP